MGSQRHDLVIEQHVKLWRFEQFSFITSNCLFVFFPFSFLLLFLSFLPLSLPSSSPALSLQTICLDTILCSFKPLIQRNSSCFVILPSNLSFPLTLLPVDTRIPVAPGRWKREREGRRYTVLPQHLSVLSSAEKAWPYWSSSTFFISSYPILDLDNIRPFSFTLWSGKQQCCRDLSWNNYTPPSDSSMPWSGLRISMKLARF